MNCATWALASFSFVMLWMQKLCQSFSKNSLSAEGLWLLDWTHHTTYVSLKRSHHASLIHQILGCQPNSPCLNGNIINHNCKIQIQTQAQVNLNIQEKAIRELFFSLLVLVAVVTNPSSNQEFQFLILSFWIQEK
jgi:hypothetical protein